MSKIMLEDGYYRTIYPDGQEIIQYVKDNKNDVGDSVDKEVEHFGAIFHRVYVIDEEDRGFYEPLAVGEDVQDIKYRQFGIAVGMNNELYAFNDEGCCATIRLPEKYRLCVKSKKNSDLLKLLKRQLDNNAVEQAKITVSILLGEDE